MRKEIIVLILLFILGGFLRFYNLNWDKGHLLHPDEQNLSIPVAKINHTFDLNPHDFTYGSFLIYFQQAFSQIFFFFSKDPSWLYNLGKINLIGRGISAFFSTFTILLFYIFVKKIFPSEIALLSTFFVTFCVFLVQIAHFATTESTLIFWLILIYLLSLKMLKRVNFEDILAGAFLLGLSTGTKISGLSFSIPLIFSIFLSKNLSFFKKIYFTLSLFFFAIFVFFFVFPYAFLDFDEFFNSTNYEYKVVKGILRVPYTLQFEKTFPYLFQIENLVWQMGPIFIFSLVGWVFLLRTAFRKKDKKLFLLLSFPCFYFLYVGSWYAKFIRYMSPLLPFLIIFASFFIFFLLRLSKKLGIIVLIFSLISQVFWGLAFFSIYQKEDTRISASKWIYKNIPYHSKILTEFWDTKLPLRLEKKTPGFYKRESLDLYGPDDQKKFFYLSKTLSNGDYLIISSKRLYGTFMKLPEKYPLTSIYYKLLFEEKLGYKKIKEFASYPEILGIKIIDDSAEETFKVFDHPKVIIFKNIKKFSREKIKKILEDYVNDIK